jgi:hypothetical protein
MPETLLSPSNILLYGRVMTDISLVRGDPNSSPPVHDPYEDLIDPELTDDGRIKDAHGVEEQECHTLPPPPPPPRLGDNNFLQRQLTAYGQTDATRPRLARIYGFSFEGHYYDLPKPAIFLVHGPGSDPEAWRPSTSLPHARVDRAPADADRTGVASTPSSFSEDMRVWSYDKSDHSLRLDSDSGTLEQILLERCVAGGGPGGYGAAVSGAAVSGAAVSGAAVSGAGAYGAGAFGAGAFGAGAFGRGRRGGGD